MFRPVYYRGLDELEGTRLYKEIPRRIIPNRPTMPHKIRKTVSCPKGAIFLFEGEKIGTRRQNVFKCPIHNDIITLPRGYDWKFIRIINYGKSAPSYSAFWWKNFPMKRRTLTYPQRGL